MADRDYTEYRRWVIDYIASSEPAVRTRVLARHPEFRENIPPHARNILRDMLAWGPPPPPVPPEE